MAHMFMHTSRSTLQHPAAHLSTLVATIKEEAQPWLPGLDTSELTRDGCFTASITNRLCKVLAAVSGALNAGSGYQAAAPLIM